MVREAVRVTQGAPGLMPLVETAVEDEEAEREEDEEINDPVNSEDEGAGSGDVAGNQIFQRGERRRKKGDVGQVLCLKPSVAAHIMINPSPPNVSSTVESSSTEAACFIFGWTSVIFTTFSIANVLLLLPLSIIILCLALQKWRQNRSYFSSASMSHCDCFTYHTVAMEMIGVAGCIVSCCAVFMGNVKVMIIGKYLFFFKWYGEVLFHLLTCLERYMAVVHPITYLSLKRGARRLRLVEGRFPRTGIMVGVLSPGNSSLPGPNVSSSASDLPLDALCFFHGWSSVIFTAFRFTFTFLLLPVSILILSRGLQKWRRTPSCSPMSHTDCFTYNATAMQLLGVVGVSVLWVLVRPGPGERGEDRQKVVQSKQRAFVTIVSTLAVLMTGDLSRVTPPLARDAAGEEPATLLTPLGKKGVQKMDGWMDGWFYLQRGNFSALCKNSSGNTKLLGIVNQTIDPRITH
ncbi:hypothetical protein CCH79_00018526 [Gambusia affinis]|uniref:Uncharacterized protein n=1 Tax=Gambusia affinis TaxID=33528 RepID=A0A315UNG1_GAMAF|nr:hypothetical protein CCH79_00018526 [Gambusia affinis]